MNLQHTLYTASQAKNKVTLAPSCATAFYKDNKLYYHIVIYNGKIFGKS